MEKMTKRQMAELIQEIVKSNVENFVEISMRKTKNNLKEMIEYLQNHNGEYDKAFVKTLILS